MKITKTQVREVEMQLFTYNRSLELCARMNYETENLDFIDKLDEQSVLYDLGACEGRFSIYAALKNIKVIAFEPEANNYKVLVENIQQNKLEDKIQTFMVGVGASNQTAILNIGQPWEGGHQKVVVHEKIRNDLSFDFKTQQEVKIIALDDFIKKQNLPIPYALKIDVDGSEMPFLQGAKETLNKVKMIIFELNKKDINYNEIIELLEAKGLHIENEWQVPNEPHLYNIFFQRKRL